MNTKEYISSGIIESYILGLASQEEAGILECVMKNNAEVKKAFEESQLIFEKLATAQAITPPTELKAKIWDKINEGVNSENLVLNEKGKSETTDLDDNIIEESTLNTFLSNNWKNYTIAASFLFLVSFGGNVFWMKKQNKKENEIEKLQINMKLQSVALQKAEEKWDMLSNPDIKAITLNGVAEHTGSKAMVFWNEKTKEVYLNAENLPKVSKGMQYQLWAIVDGKPISAGLYTENSDSVTPLSIIERAQNFAITLEKEGGSESPTMENMYVIGAV
ncbi:anti-sigma factor [Myroides guanonis]|uniref:Anti-sigma-K factor rskA n=1 Tax=Myroides guanonis TaxID=1150112 RepID=A0A1I3L1Y4_9FLAO|nr:anti-sigma factor [Myroides guanonis]SFI78405.1 Anti-sigma-K factor rskA [Myroides guanonis]